MPTCPRLGKSSATSVSISAGTVAVARQRSSSTHLAMSSGVAVRHRPAGSSSACTVVVAITIALVNLGQRVLHATARPQPLSDSKWVSYSWDNTLSNLVGRKGTHE